MPSNSLFSSWFMLAFNMDALNKKLPGTKMVKTRGMVGSAPMEEQLTKRSWKSAMLNVIISVLHPLSTSISVNTFMSFHVACKLRACERYHEIMFVLCQYGLKCFPNVIYHGHAPCHFTSSSMFISTHTHTHFFIARVVSRLPLYYFPRCDSKIKLRVPHLSIKFYWNGEKWDWPTKRKSAVVYFNLVRLGIGCMWVSEMLAEPKQTEVSIVSYHAAAYIGRIEPKPNPKTNQYFIPISGKRHIRPISN